MDNKKDWEELEKWNKEQELERRKKYKIDDKTMEESKAKTQKFTSTLNKITKKLFKIVCVIGILMIIGVGSFIINTFTGISNRLNVNIIKALEDRYNMKFEIVSQETDEKGDGLYQLICKNNSNIHCLAIKKGSSVNDDFGTNSLKYHFEKWNNNYKEKFNVEEYRDENNFLKYTIWAKANEYSEIDKIINSFLDFKNESKKYWYVDWKVEIRDGEYKNATYFNGTVEESKRSAKRDYVIWHKDNNYNLDTIPEEELKLYYKPHELVVYLNGDIVLGHDNNSLKANYLLNKDEYSIGLDLFVEALGLKNEKNQYGIIEKFIYNGKEYNLKTNVFYEENLYKIFNAKIEYDYFNKKMYIEIER